MHSARPHLPDAVLCHILVSSAALSSAAANMPGRMAISRAWSEDDHLSAYRAFRLSCKPISAQRGPRRIRSLGRFVARSLPRGQKLPPFGWRQGQGLFRGTFSPLANLATWRGSGFVTGYYEPVIDGSRNADRHLHRGRSIAVLRICLFRGVKQSAGGLPNKGQVFRKIGRRKLVPYYDRAEIEDGAIAGRASKSAGSKIKPIYCSRKSRARRGSASRMARPSASITTRITVIPIRRRPHPDRPRHRPERPDVDATDQGMDGSKSDGAKELRRQNRSYVFFSRSPALRQG